MFTLAFATLTTGSYNCWVWLFIVETEMFDSQLLFKGFGCHFSQLEWLLSYLCLTSVSDVSENDKPFQLNYSCSTAPFLKMEQKTSPHTRRTIKTLQPNVHLVPDCLVSAGLPSRGPCLMNFVMSCVCLFRVLTQQAAVWQWPSRKETFSTLSRIHLNHCFFKITWWRL